MGGVNQISTLTSHVSAIQPAPIALQKSGVPLRKRLRPEVGSERLQRRATRPPRPKMSEDVIPFTAYRRHLRECCERTKRTHRPLFITQNGRATTVVMNIAEYEEREELFAEWQARMERAQLSRDVEISRREFAQGRGIPAEEVFDSIRAKLDQMKAVGLIR